ncbi:hypothetical protein ABR36_08975 [Enterobacter ludwigii]|nr:hypothetical protein ABR36_08975 [Enterobacter ludwigii]
MFIPTDILRAALHCVAGPTNPRKQLQGVHVTKTHIEASNGHVAVSMEHDAGPDTVTEGVFIVNGDIPEDAEGTIIHQVDGGWRATHCDEDEVIIGENALELVGCCFPDLKKIIPKSTEPCAEFPPFKAAYLALPEMMFGCTCCLVAIKLRPFGPESACQVLFDPGVNRLFGNPLMFIMPMKSDVFEMFDNAMTNELVH